jgi:hypothetical protein
MLAKALNRPAPDRDPVDPNAVAIAVSNARNGVNEVGRGVGIDTRRLPGSPSTPQFRTTPQ